MRHRFVGIGDQAHMAGHGGDAGGRGELLRGDLVAHGLDGAGGGPTKMMPSFFSAAAKAAFSERKP
jgi:hypothetical protein